MVRGRLTDEAAARRAFSLVRMGVGAGMARGGKGGVEECACTFV